MVKILDSSDDETNEMEVEPGSSSGEEEETEKKEEEELDLPDGTFIVLKIVDHRRYGELRRKKMIDQRRNEHVGSLYFRVQWKGFPGEDTWEPLETVHKVDPFKDYARKHNLTYLIPAESESSDTEGRETDEESETEKDSGSDKGDEKSGWKRRSKPEKKSKQVNTASRNKYEKKEFDYVSEDSHKEPLKKTWWLRNHKKTKNLDIEKLIIARKRKLVADSHLRENERKLSVKNRKTDIQLTTAPGLEQALGFVLQMLNEFQRLRRFSFDEYPRTNLRTYVKKTSSEFAVAIKRTRSVSPIVLREMQWKRTYDDDKSDGRNFRDDQYFLNSTKVSVAVARAERAYLARKAKQGSLLGFFWKEICNRKLRSPLGRIRNAEPCKLENVLTQIIRECRAFDLRCDLLRKYLAEGNAFGFAEELQNLQILCQSYDESFDAVVFDELTAYWNWPMLTQSLSEKCAPIHSICGIFKALLSNLSCDYRAKLFEQLRRETKNRLLDIIVDAARNDGEFCVLDTFIKYGVNVGFVKICALQQCVLNGDEQTAVHLLLNGFEAKHVELSSSDSSLNDQSRQLLDMMIIYMDRLNSKMQDWTMELLKEHSDEFVHFTDAMPTSSIYVHRIGQLDRKICLTVSSAKFLPATICSNRASQVLLMHSFGLSSSSASINDITINRRRLPVHFQKHLQFRLGARVDEMDLFRILQKHGSCIYWFPQGHSNELGARVHVKLSYTPTEFNNEHNDLLLLQLWNIQFSPALRLLLRKKI